VQVKSISFILSIFFLCSALNISAAVQKLFFEGSSCCSTEMVTDSCEQKKDQKDDCCDSGNCNCMCCASLFVIDFTLEETPIKLDFVDANFSISNLHIIENSSSIFHPPLFR
jgi:hypothetical protein